MMEGGGAQRAVVDLLVEQVKPVLPVMRLFSFCFSSIDMVLQT